MGNNAPDYKDNLFFDPKADYEKLDSLAAGLVLDQELPRSAYCAAIHLEKANAKLREDIKYLSQIRKGQSESIRLWIYRCEELKKENDKLKKQLSEHRSQRCYSINGVLVSETKYLRELLKECQSLLERYKADYYRRDLPTNEFLFAINEVLK